MLDSGFWILDIGCWILDIRYLMLDSGHVEDWKIGCESPPFQRACPDRVTYREDDEAGGFVNALKMLNEIENWQKDFTNNHEVVQYK